VTYLLAAAVLLTSSAHPQLTPLGAQLDRAWRVSPRQVLVEWHRVERVAPKGGGEKYEAPYMLWRLVLWTRTDRWRPSSIVGGSWAQSPIDEVSFADLTHDGRPELLVSDVQGNHGSGPYRVVLGGLRPVTILAGEWAESWWRVRDGVLTIVEPRGGRSVCCPEFRAFVRYRWTGRRLVVAGTRLVRQHY
jgi:hypothetical protein